MISLPSQWRWIAHRGLSAAYPENTLVAFEAACKAGEAFVELDIVLSGEGTPFVFHDTSTARLFPGTGRAIARMRDAQIRALRVSGQPIPDLFQVLDLLKNYGVVPYLEMKAKDPRVPDLTLEAVQKVGIEVIFSSFHLAHLRRLQELKPTTRRMGLFASRWGTPWASESQQLFDEIGLPLAGATLPRLAATQGKPVFVYTVNTPAQALDLARMGAQGVFCDHGSLLISAPPPPA